MKYSTMEYKGEKNNEALDSPNHRNYNLLRTLLYFAELVNRKQKRKIKKELLDILKETLVDRMMSYFQQQQRQHPYHAQHEQYNEGMFDVSCRQIINNKSGVQCIHCFFVNRRDTLQFYGREDFIKKHEYQGAHLILGSQRDRSFEGSAY